MVRLLPISSWLKTGAIKMQSELWLLQMAQTLSPFLSLAIAL